MKVEEELPLVVLTPVGSPSPPNPPDNEVASTSKNTVLPNSSISPSVNCGTVEQIMDPNHQQQNPELDFLIAKYLAGGRYWKTGQALIAELESNQVIPPSTNWQGQSVPQDFHAFNSKISHHIGPNYLNELLQKLLSDSQINSNKRKSPSPTKEPVAGTSGTSATTSGDGGSGTSSSLIPAFSHQPTSLLSVSTSSLVYGRNRSKGSGSFSGDGLITHPLCHRATSHLRLNIANSFNLRNLYGTALNHRTLHPDLIFTSRFGLVKRSMGHLSSVYCVLFDNSGKYIITGADDKLVKIWSIRDGRLIMTLRGNSSEITDLAVNLENTLLATSTCDKHIKIWSLSTGELLTTLSSHTGNVTSVFFCPMSRKWSPIVRYLASTGKDGSVCFWAYRESPGKKVIFDAKPTEFQERMRPGSCQMLCSGFSTGGVFFAAGNADCNVRVYYMLDPEGPKRILENQTHTDRVDSISWAHSGIRFISGSKDGLALVWRLDPKAGGWRYTKIDVKYPEESSNSSTSRHARLNYRVTMVGWSCDDRFVFTAIATSQTQSHRLPQANISVKVWNSTDGSLLRILNAHTDDVYVVEPHPTHPRVLCTAGHDGKIILWDVGSFMESELTGGKVLYEYKNMLEEQGQGYAAVFDTKWSPDGTSLAGTDSHGNLLIFSIYKSDKYSQVPDQLFFHTDYRPLTVDAITGQIADEQTQILPHLMPPPFLVNSDGAPYPIEFQRLVPGRENCRDEQLIPNVAESADGERFQVLDQPGRSIIDQRIAELAAQVVPPVQENQNPDQPRRPSGQGQPTEGVRHTRGNWQRDNLPAAASRQLHHVPPISPSQLSQSDGIRWDNGELEESTFQNFITGKHFSESNTRVLQDQGGLTAATAAAQHSYHSRRLRQLAASAAEQRRIEEERRRHEQEGVPLPNPPQMEISSPQFPRMGGGGAGSRNRNAGGTSRPSRARPQPLRFNQIIGRPRRSRFGIQRFEDVDIEDDNENILDPSFSESGNSSSSSSSDSDGDVWGRSTGTAAAASHSNHNEAGSSRRQTLRRQNSSDSQPPILPAEEPQSPQPRPTGRGRGGRRGARRAATSPEESPEAEETPPQARQPRRQRARQIIESENEEEAEDESVAQEVGSEEEEAEETPESGSSGAEGGDATGSDWSDENPNHPNTEGPKGRKGKAKRKSLRKRRGSKAEDEENEPNDDASDEDYEDARPGTSAHGGGGVATRKSMKDEVSPTTSGGIAKKSRPKRSQVRKNLDETLHDNFNRPSDWLALTATKRFPYYPQLGDDLVYCRQGHEKYINKIKELSVYPVDKRFMKSLPFKAYPHLPAQVSCRVTQISYDNKPPVIVTLKLTATDWDSGEVSHHVNYSVSYHDLENVVDFLILRQYYDKSMRHNWNIGDRFRCLIDNTWWLGNILNVAPNTEQFPDSQFLRYTIRWDDGREEQLSPWDLDIVPDNFVQGDTSNGIDATPEEIRDGLYEVSPADWPPHGHQDIECDRILAHLSTVMELSLAEAFLVPVDLNSYPDYLDSVKCPIDLTTIKTRLENRFYRRIDAIKFDIKLLNHNTETFNRPRSEIVKKSRILRDLLLGIVDGQFDDPTTNFHSLQSNFMWDESVDKEEENRKNSEATKTRDRRLLKELNQGNGPSTSAAPGTSSTSGARSTRLQAKKLGPGHRLGGASGSSNTNTRTSSVPIEDDSDRPWHERCLDLLLRLYQHRDSEPFRAPVDPTEYADYHRQIDTPMDLNTIREELMERNYTTPIQFNKDMHLIFSNSKQYNTDKHSQIYKMTLSLKLMYEHQFAPILSDWKRYKNRRCNSKRENRTPMPTTSRQGQDRTNSRKKSLRKRKSEPSPSPRKNPIRSAAARNPYVHHDDEDEEEEEFQIDEPESANENDNDTSFDEDEDSESEPVADGDQYRDKRKRKKRRRKSSGASSTPARPTPKKAKRSSGRATTTRSSLSTNRDSESPPAPASTSRRSNGRGASRSTSTTAAAQTFSAYGRPVKRLRLESSEDEDESAPENGEEEDEHDEEDDEQETSNRGGRPRRAVVARSNRNNHRNRRQR